MLLHKFHSLQTRKRQAQWTGYIYVKSSTWWSLVRTADAVHILEKFWYCHTLNAATKFDLKSKKTLKWVIILWAINLDTIEKVTQCINWETTIYAKEVGTLLRWNVSIFHFERDNISSKFAIQTSKSICMPGTMSVYPFEVVVRSHLFSSMCVTCIL